jgi:hypothetical protein
LAHALHFPTWRFLLEACVQGGEGLWLSEGFLDVLDLDVGLHEFVDELEQAGVDDGVVASVATHELVLENVGQHLLGLAYELLPELELLPDHYLDPGNPLRYSYGGVLLPLLDGEGECGDCLVAEDDVGVFLVVGEGGDLVEVGYLSDVPADEELCGVAVVVADLVDAPEGGVEGDAVVGQGGDQDASFEGEELFDVEAVQFESRVLRFLVLLEVAREQVEGLLEGVEVPADEVADDEGAVLVAEGRAGGVDGHAVVEGGPAFVAAGVLDDRLGDLLDQVLDVVLEKHCFCGRFEGEGRDVVPEVLEVVDEVVVAQRGGVVDHQAHV